MEYAQGKSEKKKKQIKKGTAQLSQTFPMEFYLTDELYYRSQCERIYALILLFCNSYPI